jgi:hypothetical protein
MKKWLIVISVFITILVVGVIYITVPKHIKESFNGYIFSKEHKFIKEVPIKLEGNWSNNFGKKEKVEGLIEIEGKSLEIKSAGLFSGIDNSKYFFTSGITNITDYKGVNEVNTCVIISKEFKTIFGFTTELVKKYGEGSYFKSSKDIETFLDK